MRSISVGLPCPQNRWRFAIFAGTIALAVLHAVAPLAHAQSQADIEKYGKAYLEIKPNYDKAISESRYRDAVKYGRQMVDYITRLWPDRKDLVGTQHHWLAIACALGGFYDEADTNYTKALELREAAHGVDHPLVAETLFNATALYRKQARYAEAEAAGKRSLAIREKRFGPDHDVVGDSANNLAAVYFDLGRLAEAEELMRRALTIHEKKFGPNHIEVAGNVANLAAVYRTAGRLNDAIEYDEHAVSIRRGASRQQARRDCFQPQ